MIRSIEEQIKENGYVITTVQGVSMKPFLLPQKTLVKLVPPVSRVHPGDCILYRRENDQVVLHRVVYCKKNGYVTTGDAYAGTVYFVPRDRVLGFMDAYCNRARWKSGRGWSARLFFWVWYAVLPIRFVINCLKH